ncbi:ABC transporter substrate-binding protein [Nocardioides sp. LHG3406-4]|uniref:ABC transporter substrate-binding protein n=1 Tax=Nocardioides sp. LHG3406-4 TaxID=2804575 RepID=UPI003CE9A68E
MSRHLRPKKSALAVLSSVLLLASLAACGSSDAKEATVDKDAALYAALPQSIKDRGSLIVGADISYAPMEFYDEDGKTPKGADIDLAKALGKVLGVPVTFANGTLASQITTLNAKRTDVIISAMTDTPERRQEIDFVDYLKAGTAIVVKKGNPEGIASLDDLCGKKVAALRGTTQEAMLDDQSAKCTEAGKPGIEQLNFDNDSQGLLQVRQGRAVANLNDFAVAKYNVETAGGGDFYEVAGDLIPAVGSYGIGVRKDDAELRDAMLKAVETIMSDGSYDAVLEKWGLEGSALDAPVVNGGQPGA